MSNRLRNYTRGTSHLKSSARFRLVGRRSHTTWRSTRNGHIVAAACLPLILFKSIIKVFVSQGGIGGYIVRFLYV